MSKDIKDIWMSYFHELESLDELEEITKALLGNNLEELEDLRINDIADDINTVFSWDRNSSLIQLLDDVGGETI